MIAIERRPAEAAGTPGRRETPGGRPSAARRKGVLALATITGLTRTSTGLTDQPEVRVSLRVEGPGLAFDTAARLVPTGARRANVDTGQLVVLVDPATRDYQIDWDRSALVNGLLPATFALADTGETVDLRGRTGPLLEILQLLWAHNVSLSRLADPRTDPALREQVLAVVRRATGG